MSTQPISTSLPPQSYALANANAAPTVSREMKAATTPTQDTTEAALGVSQEQLKTAIKSVREYIQPFNNSLEFSVSDETQQLVVKIVDTATKEVIRQMPSEEMIALAKALDSLKGLFVKQSA